MSAVELLLTQTASNLDSAGSPNIRNSIHQPWNCSLILGKHNMNTKLHKKASKCYNNKRNEKVWIFVSYWNRYLYSKVTKATWVRQSKLSKCNLHAIVKEYVRYKETHSRHAHIDGLVQDWYKNNPYYIQKSRQEFNIQFLSYMCWSANIHTSITLSQNNKDKALNHYVACYFARNLITINLSHAFLISSNCKLHLYNANDGTLRW